MFPILLHGSTQSPQALPRAERVTPGHNLGRGAGTGGSAQAGSYTPLQWAVRKVMDGHCVGLVSNVLIDEGRFSD